jgi:hypothetical protein
VLGAEVAQQIFPAMHYILTGNSGISCRGFKFLNPVTSKLLLTEKLTVIKNFFTVL